MMKPCLNKLRCYNSSDINLNFLIGLMDKSIWSSGMIPASGAGGPGFESRNGPKTISFVCHRAARALLLESDLLELIGT